ncbi:unnamed protein product [Caretta caretta]
MEIQMQPVCGVCILDPAEKVELQDSAWRRGSYRMADGEIESHKESSTYLLKWKPIVCVANRTAEEEKAAVQEFFHIGMRVNVLQMVQEIPLQAAKLDAWSCKVLSALNAF